MNLLLLLAATAAFAQGDAQMCAGCHGAQGEGNPQTGAPRIAGQPVAYLQRQLDAYADGRRDNAVMSPIAKQLSPDQRAALASHYADVRAPAKQSAAAGGSAPQRAVTLATHGDESKRIQACANCHGPGGTGMADINPYLAGLDAKYLASAMAEWKSGARRTDPSGQMPRIAKSLSVADVQALAAYYAAQPSPQPRPATAPAKASSKGAQQGGGSETQQRPGVTGNEESGSQGPGGAQTK
jgi:cytochrome c553